ncbi:MAG: HEPN domain-containing protein [Candidatus Bathyarchaeia archaeon]
MVSGMSFEEAEVLRRRAEAFLKNAEYLLKSGEWDLAVFNLEQYCQLILKYKLLIKVGSYPRTHSLRRLIRELAGFHPKLLSLVEDEKELHYVARLEEAYVTSRYIPYSYEEGEAQSLHRFVTSKFKLLVDEV